MNPTLPCFPHTWLIVLFWHTGTVCVTRSLILFSFLFTLCYHSHPFVLSVFDGHRLSVSCSSSVGSSSHSICRLLVVYMESGTCWIPLHSLVIHENSAIISLIGADYLCGERYWLMFIFFFLLRTEIHQAIFCFLYSPTYHQPPSHSLHVN